MAVKPFTALSKLQCRPFGGQEKRPPYETVGTTRWTMVPEFGEEQKKARDLPVAWLPFEDPRRQAA
jgi:hypothetical protein